MINIKIPEQNQVILTGRLTRDPQSAYTQKGSAVCYFDIAVNRRYKDQNTNEWKDDVTYVPIVVWGQLAERCKEKLKKGSPVHVEGRLTTSEYNDKEGNKRKILKVVGRKIQFLAVSSHENDTSVEQIEENDGIEDLSDKSSDSGIDDVPF